MKKEEQDKINCLRPNYSIISKLIKPNSSVLDLGCGSGILLEELSQTHNIKALGIEIEQSSVIEALEKGLPIIQANIDDGLSEFDDKQWDYVVLNQTLQSTHKPDFVIDEMLRVGKKVIVSFPNFAYWKVRFYLFFNGKMPKSKFLPFEWYDTPNIHLLTVNDFFDFCKDRNIKIENSIYCTQGKTSKWIFKGIANFLSEEVIFTISK